MGYDDCSYGNDSLILNDWNDDDSVTQLAAVEFCVHYHSQLAGHPLQTYIELYHIKDRRELPYH